MDYLKKKNKIASALVEYGLMLAIVALALTTMNIYFKRGLQGKVKDMTDFFITGGRAVQQEDSDPSYITSNSTSASTIDSTTQELFEVGGRAKNILTATSNVAAQGKTVVSNQPNSNPGSFVPSTSGATTTPVGPRELDQMEQQAQRQLQEAQARLQTCGGNAACISECQRDIADAQAALLYVAQARQLLAQYQDLIPEQGE